MRPARTDLEPTVYPPLPPALRDPLKTGADRLQRMGPPRVLALGMVVLGVLAIALPLAAGTALAVILTWLLLLAGVVHIAHSIVAPRLGTFAWHAAIGVAYVFAWLFLIPRPSLGLNMITLAASFLFMLEGALRTAVYLRLHRHHPPRGRASPWPLLDGLLTLGLGFLIFWTWPQSSDWAVGLLLGLSLVVSGLSRMLPPPAELAARARRWRSGLQP